MRVKYLEAYCFESLLDLNFRYFGFKYLKDWISLQIYKRGTFFCFLKESLKKTYFSWKNFSIKKNLPLENNFFLRKIPLKKISPDFSRYDVKIKEIQPFSDSSFFKILKDFVKILILYMILFNLLRLDLDVSEYPRIFENWSSEESLTYFQDSCIFEGSKKRLLQKTFLKSKELDLQEQFSKHHQLKSSSVLPIFFFRYLVQ